MAEQEGDLLTDGVAEGKPAANADNQQPGGSEAGATPEASGTDQSTRPKWMDQLSGDLKDSGSLTKFKTLNDLGKSYEELEGRLGKSVEVPGENANAEDWSQFYAQVGRPKTKDDYSFQAVEGLEGDEPQLDAYKEQAHKAGLTNAQATDLLKWHAGESAKAIRSVRQMVDKRKADAESALREQWGSEYEKNMNLATRALSNFADKGFVEFVKETGLGNHPEMVKVFAKIGQTVSEGSAPRGETPRSEEANQLTYPHLREMVKNRSGG